ncbi:hypothetical protein [Mesorhizobium sp. M7A.F.Ca.MR.245.00.0.0]|uniref:hypothetical protein n=1 Tax=Mesorhizobium sp. M7A.F.Ca.MR.245.00.0.0 TaxID=2496778 RepID=UPI0019CF9AEA|nr:hypothetical protein [Mesorhizobium sp. M7A.F.Ca.MR.245.00.0.0]
MSWTFADVKGHVLGVVLIVAVFAAVLIVDPIKWTNRASPIRSVEMIDATVKTVPLKMVRRSSFLTIAHA